MAVDGFEADFGPIPPERSPKAWVDRVALERFRSGARVGRNLTPGETRALHLLSVMREDGT